MAATDADHRSGFIRYLTWSEEDEKWQLVCTDAGHNEITPGTVYPPNKDSHPPPFKSVAVGRTLTEYQVIYITKGRGIFEAGHQTYTVTPGTVMIVFPGVPHYYKPEYEVGWTEYWVGFRGPYADHLSAEGFLSARKPFHEVGLQNGLVAIYDQIFELVRSQRPLYQLRASSCVLALIAEILALERRAEQHSQSEQIVEKAKFYMEENVYSELNLNRIGDLLGVSTSHLNAVFKSYTAMTPYQYFISIKIRKAKELLERGDLSVKEVAFRLGFTDQYYFSRLFRRKTGLPPSRWGSFVYRRVRPFGSQ
ncbi:MAG TPA: AraC family transcriptional regulator [Spirochaetia bacterium]